MKILIISAHTGDMETAMAGTTYLLKEAGHEIVSVVCKTLSPHKNRHRKESTRSHQRIGIEPIFFELINNKGLVTQRKKEKFLRLLYDIKPDAVFTHWGTDVHPDHRIIASLSMEAFMQKKMNVEYFCYEVANGIGRPQSLHFIPNFYVDIAGSPEDIKKQMVFCCKSHGTAKLWATCREMQHIRGVEHGMYVAESFVRLTRLGSIALELRKTFSKSTHSLPNSIGVYQR